MLKTYNKNIQSCYCSFLMLASFILIISLDIWTYNSINTKYDALRLTSLFFWFMVAIILFKHTAYHSQVINKLTYLSSHDQLTGLYSRPHFEQQMIEYQNKHMKAGILICDINGLKIINDTLGHDAGDKLIVAASSCLEAALQGQYHIYRIGSDEFAILLYDIDIEQIYSITKQIHTNIAANNAINSELPLTVSWGYAVRNNNLVTLQQLFKDADCNMQIEKYNSADSSIYSIISSFIKILEARDLVTKEHVLRIKDLIVYVCTNLDIPEPITHKMKLLAQLHDIGKIGIPDLILNKPDKLTTQEYKEMKSHCEIGFRIINTIPSLEEVAELVLMHHEWWDGSGYPLKLKGEEIPLECRIFTIIDAYDVITHERPYKEANTHEEAINEICRCMGTQFDPFYASKIISVLGERHKSS